MSNGQATATGPAKGPLDVDPGLRPDAVRMIGDIETLKALSDPLRLRIIETMVQRPDAAWSVKEIAAALDVPQTRLYHHIDQLSTHDLIRPVGRRVVSGIIETRYGVVARSFQLDRRLFAGGSEESRAALHDTLVSVFDTARHEIEVAAHTGTIDASASAPPERRLLLSHGLVHLTPGRAAELRQRLVALIEEFDSDDGAESATYGTVFAVYPIQAAPDGIPAASAEAAPSPDGIPAAPDEGPPAADEIPAVRLQVDG